MSHHTPATVARNNRRSPVTVMAAVIAGTFMLALGTGAAASSRVATTSHAGTGYQQDGSPGPSAGDLIPLTPLAGLTSLDATVTVTVDGTLNGKPKQGTLTAQLTSNDQPASQIDVTGSLLGDIVAQVGGSAVKLFRPSKVSVYTVPDGTYVLVDGLFDVCIKPSDNAATEALAQLSPASLMAILTSDGVARGTFVADETLNGMPVKHYTMNGAAFLAAAQASTVPAVSTFAQSLTSATDGDLYLAADGGYPVAYRGGFSGAFAPLAMEGDVTVQIDLTGINNNTPVTLPGACDNPISH